MSILRSLWLRRRLFLGLPGGMAVLVAVFVLLQPTRFEAESSFVTSGPRQAASGLIALASTFGASLPRQQGETPEFYLELIRSRVILEDLLRRSFAVESAPEVTLFEIIDPSGDTPEQRTRTAVGTLRNKVVTSFYDPKSQVFHLRIRTSDPSLAEAINRALLGLLDTYNVEKRSTQARAEREFLEKRLRGARHELRAVEDSLERFQLENRLWQDSPELTLVHGRLQRNMLLRQQIHGLLAESYEEARIDEVRDTPVLSLVDPPEGSARPAGIGIVLGAIIGIILGGGIAVGIVVIQEYVRYMREGTNVAGAARV